jgi:hypothetical protein
VNSELQTFVSFTEVRVGSCLAPSKYPFVRRCQLRSGYLVSLSHYRIEFMYLYCYAFGFGWFKNDRRPLAVS